MKKGGEQNTIYMFLSMDPHSYIDIVHLLIHRPWRAPMHSPLSCNIEHNKEITLPRKNIWAEVCPILLLTLFFPSLFNKKTSPFTFAHSIVVLFLSFRGLGTYNLGQKIFQIEANTPVNIKYSKFHDHIKSSDK